MFFLILSGILLAIGFYMIAADALRIPYMEVSRAAENLSKKQVSITNNLDVWLGGVAEWLAGHIRINEFKRQALEIDLRTAQRPLTPERFRANSIVKAALVGLLSIPSYFILPTMSVIYILIAVWIYNRENTKLRSAIQKKRKSIEYELPRLVGSIEKNLKHSHNVLRILENYSKSAGPELQHELSITLADMRSGNYQRAITRLEARVGSPLLSEVCRGLIAVINGDDTVVYWSALQIKFSDHQRQELRRRAQRIPIKCSRLSLYLLLCMIAMYLTVIFIYFLDSMGILFG